MMGVCPLSLWDEAFKSESRLPMPGDVVMLALSSSK